MDAALSFPIENWPSHDLACWTAALEGHDFDASRVAGWRHSTRKQAANVYGLWLKWLHDNGRLSGEDPALRATGQNVRDFAKEQLSRGLALVTVATRVQVLVALVKGMYPHADLSDARRVRNRLIRAAKRTVQPKGHIVHASHLYRLGLLLIDQGRASDLAAREGANLYLDGLAIALLTACPVRIGTFTSLRLDREMVRDANSWRVVVAGNDTKTHEPEVRMVPAGLTAALDEYVAVVRPRLLAKRKGDHIDEHAFFISSRGRPLLDQMMRKRIVARTEKAFGKPILPHGFRKAAITTLVMEHPKHAPAAPLLLSHTGTKTAENHYIIRQQRLALDHYHQRLDKVQRGRPQGSRLES